MTEIRQLGFAYRRRKPLFAELALELADGNIYGLLGKNGAGKTTLLRLIAGLLFPQSGGCRVDGHPSSRRLPRTLEELYFLPEEFELPGVSPRTYRRLFGALYPRFDDQRFGRCLQEFQVAEDEDLSKMSYGQKKKFLVAFGLATDCRLLLLDEPTNGLDIPSKRQFRRMVAAELTPERTFLISTHQVRDMENLIDPIVILEQGRIVFQQDGYSVSQRLTAALQPSEPEPGEALYWEKVPGGCTVIRERRAGDEPSQVDLELLFNAVVGDPARIGGIFSREAGR